MKTANLKNGRVYILIEGISLYSNLLDLIVIDSYFSYSIFFFPYSLPNRICQIEDDLSSSWYNQIVLALIMFTDNKVSSKLQTYIRLIVCFMMLLCNTLWEKLDVFQGFVRTVGIVLHNSQMKKILKDS